MNNIIDSHFHLSSVTREEISNLIQQGFKGGINIGTVCDDLPERTEALKDLPGIEFSAAMGPWECGKSETKEETDVDNQQFKSTEQINKEFEILKKNINLYNPLFIGECGLDYYWEYGTREKQKNLFIKHLDLAGNLKKKIIIHSRDANEDTAKLIKEYNNVNGIIHCCNGNIMLIKTALDLGYYISFAGNITFKKNNELRESLSYVPKDRLLLETDAPYLSPVPLRGQKNTPANIIHTYRCVSEVLGLSYEDLKLRILQNFNQIRNI